jgi:hypothetical protein
VENKGTSQKLLNGKSSKRTHSLMSQSISECRQTTMPSAFESKSKLSLDQGSQLLGSQHFARHEQNASNSAESQLPQDARDSTIKSNMFHVRPPISETAGHEVYQERPYDSSGNQMDSINNEQCRLDMEPRQSRRSVHFGDSSASP